VAVVGSASDARCTSTLICHELKSLGTHELPVQNANSLACVVEYGRQCEWTVNISNNK
jgi:hypothetical protein